MSPVIPQAVSEGNIRVGTPPEMGLGAVRASEQAQKGLVQAIRGMEETVTNIRDFRQQNEASAFVFEQLSNQKALAAEDINFDSTPYETAIDEIGQKAARTISGGMAREEFMASFQRQAMATKWGIKNNFRAKELEASYANNEYVRQQIVSSYAGMSEAEKINSIKTYKDLLTNGINKGIYTKDQANQIDLKFRQDIQESVVNNDVINNPEAALVELNKGKEGEYPGISEQFRIDSKEKAKAYEKKYKSEAELNERKRIDTNEDNVIKQMLDPQKPKPTELDIVNLMNNGDISPKFAKALVGNLRSVKEYKPTALEGWIKYNELVERKVFLVKKEKAWFSKASFEELTKFRADVIGANSTGYISDTQMTNLLSETSKAFYRDPVFQNALNQLASQSKMYTTSEAQSRVKAEMYGNLIEKVVAGKPPRDAVTEVVRERLAKEIGEVIKIQEQGNRIFAKKGKQRIYSGDGGTTWKDETTNEVVK